MTSPLDLSLINGPIPAAATVAGAVALLFLGVRRDRPWWTRVLPIAALSCATVTVAVALLVNEVWHPWPEPLPMVVVGWLGVTLLASTLAVLRLRGTRWYWRAASLAAAAVVLTSALVGVNTFFGQYPTPRAALGVFSKDTSDLDSVAMPTPTKQQLPEHGAVSETPIPSSGGFAPRPAWIYLPPAYAVAPRPKLPVLVLLSGQPGSPRDWFDAGQLAKNLDAFAQQHNGRAPIVVVPDQLGSLTANPMCLDSKLGTTETYLARDVPAWIKQRLQVDERREAWTIAGFSQGGTCAFQLAVRAPSVYANFIDLTGQREPTLGTRAASVKAAFDGDDAAYSRVNPWEIVAKARFPDTAGVVVAGRDDSTYRSEDRQVFEACQRAGMEMQWKEMPSGHDWNTWRPGLYEALPWLAQRTGLLEPR
ncbi:esterase [Solihabitans fulvus]|uniref:Esterase n=1 Tax=Solihabitans fulvus TaxID=1892852 RepID=A0A5B2XAM9_9PSEU|nr:alpha/beta hydrolase-fold protein [Solihabitans fulvus]KAA2260667.1 esterase [Solihabitans fulvus]